MSQKGKLIFSKVPHSLKQENLRHKIEERRERIQGPVDIAPRFRHQIRALKKGERE
jgi:hypothetical protein